MEGMDGKLKNFTGLIQARTYKVKKKKYFATLKGKITHHKADIIVGVQKNFTKLSK